MALLEVNDLHTSFFTDAGEVKAVDGVSFRLDHGKVLGMFQQPFCFMWHIAIQGLTRKIGIAATQRIGGTEPIDKFTSIR